MKVDLDGIQKTVSDTLTMGTNENNWSMVCKLKQWKCSSFAGTPPAFFFESTPKWQELDRNSSADQQAVATAQYGNANLTPKQGRGDIPKFWNTTSNLLPA